METRTNKADQVNPELDDAVRAAREYGIDVAMLIDNLKCSPAERIRRHQIALETMETLQQAQQEKKGFLGLLERLFRVIKKRFSNLKP